MRRTYLSLILLLGLSSAACDLVVAPRQTLTLGSGGQIFGSPGNDRTAGNDAVTVNPTGTLIVEDADLFGGDDSFSRQPGGTVGGGELTRGGDAIRAEAGQVTLLSGTLQGGDVTGRRAFGFAGNGVDLTGATLRVRGGAIRAGRASGLGAPGTAVVAVASMIEVTGGIIDDLELRATTALFRGGRIGSVSSILQVIDRLPPVPEPVPEARNCLEISGGDVRGPIRLDGPSDLFVLGTTFNLPFGEVTTEGPIALIGRLADGSPLSVFVFRSRPRSRVFLIERDAIPVEIPESCLNRL